MGDGVYGMLYTLTNHNLTFATNNAAPQMTLDTSGNVGIGTSTNFDSLNGRGNLVVGSGSGNEGITIYSGSGSQGGIIFADGTSGTAAYPGQIQYTHSDNSMRFYVTDGSEKMRIDTSGNVGINNTNPTSAKLVVKSAGGGTERTFQTTDASNNETFWIQGGGATGLQYWPFYVGKSSTATGNAYVRSGEYIQAQGPIAGGKNGRYIHDWWGPQITGSGPYMHLVTKMWGGGSPHGNTEYIMGGFMITGYRYSSGTKQHRAMHQFHNWSGSLYYHGVVDDGDWTGASHVYVNSSGFVTVRLAAASYHMYTIDFVQYNQYDKIDVGISAETTSSSATI